MKEATMLFRGDEAEGAVPDTIWGIPLFTITVDASDVETYLDAGWHRHPFDVRDAREAAKTKEPAPDENGAPTLEQRAEAVGLKIDGRWSPEKLAQKVAEAEAAKAKG